MANITNDYFMNMLEVGSEATDAEMIYLLVPSLPSKYLYICIYYHAYNVLSVHPILKLFFLILKLDYILSDLSAHVLSQSETEERYRQIGRQDLLSNNEV